MPGLHIHTQPLFQVELEKTAGSRRTCFGVMVHIGLFNHELKSTLKWVVIIKCKQNTTYTLNTKDKQKQTAPTNRTTYTLIWYAFYDLRPEEMKRALFSQSWSPHGAQL